MADSDATAVVVGATETTQVTQTTATTVKQKWWTSLTNKLDPGVVIGIIAVVFVIAGLVIAFVRNAYLLRQLQEQAFARGLITFIFTLGTLAIAITLVGSALFSDANDDNKFRRAREVFSVLAGVLGTIVGFYFGSSGTDGPRPTLAPVRIVEAGSALQLSAFVSGGTPPYEYDIDLDGKSMKDDAPTRDGWIAETLGAPSDKVTGELRVRDAKGQAVDAQFTYPTSGATPPPSAPPAAQAPAAP